MISVDDALALILEGVLPLDKESVAVGAAAGRTLARDLHAVISQPPFDASALDGYAVRFADASAIGARLRVIGRSRAGAGLGLAVGEGEAARIFTGGRVPPGADHIVTQEDVRREGDAVVIAAHQGARIHIRRAGRDFSSGDALLPAGARLSAIDAALAAAANCGSVIVRRRPRLAYFDNGDELCEPGSALGEDEIVGSTRYALDGLFALWGAEPRYLGRARDRREDARGMFERARGADLIVAVGGASVGDFDCVKAGFEDAGGRLGFDRVNVKPGKPTWFGSIGAQRAIGLPGNPASSIVTALLFIAPLVDALLGATRRRLCAARLAGALDANGPREEYLRARRIGGEAGIHEVAAFADQDSSLLLPFARADCLIRRKPGAAAGAVGDRVEIVPLAFGDNR